MEPRERIRALLLAIAPKRAQIQALKDDEPLWDAGALDSLGIVRLVHFLQSEFGVEIPSKDINLTTFRSIASIGDYIGKKAGG